MGVDPSPAKKDELTNWARTYWEATHPYSAGGAYVNFMAHRHYCRLARRDSNEAA